MKYFYYFFLLKILSSVSYLEEIHRSNRIKFPNRFFKISTYIIIIITLFVNQNTNAQGASQCAYFASNDYASTGSYLNFRYTEFTFDMWVNANDWTPSTDQVIISKYYSSKGYRIWIDASPDRIVFEYWINGNAEYLYYSIPSGFSGWHHIAATISSSDADLYIDGNAADDGNPSSTIDYSLWSVTIFGEEAGQYGVPTGKNYQGRIDELRYWDVKLSQSQIQEWMHKEIQSDDKPSNITNLWVYYRFNTAEGGFAEDYGNSVGGIITDYDLDNNNEASLVTSTAPLLDNIPLDYSNDIEALWQSETTTFSEESDGLALRDNSGELGTTEYYVFGADISTGTTSTNTPSNINLRSSQIWYLYDYANDAVDFQFDLSDFASALDVDTYTENNYFLLRRSGTTGDFAVVSVGNTSKSGDVITFLNYTPTTGYYAIGVETFSPTLSTDAVSNIVETSATSGGTITNNGGLSITAKGACWNTTGSPTTSSSITSDGTGDDAFVSSLSGLSPGTTYYVRAYASNSEGTSYGDEQIFTTNTQTLTWDGSESSDWHTSANWDGDIVPTSNDHIVISSSGTAPVIGSGLSGDCKNLTINSGATLTIESGGSIITTGTISNNGTFNIQRSISNGKWHLISSPVSNALSGMFSGDYVQTWSEEDAWWYEVSATDEVLTPVKGFGFWSDGSGSDTHTFSGTPNTGDQSISLTSLGSGGEYNRANLIGNPYPSSINWADLDDTYGAVNYYNGTAYVSWNDGSGSGSQYIPPSQGFFIVPASSGTLNLNNDNRVHNNASAFYKSNNTIVNGVVITTSNGDYEDDLWIKFSVEATQDFDFTFDAYKFLTNVEGISQLYSKNGESQFSIDVRPETDLIPLGFTNNENGDYSIYLKQINGIAKAELEDSKLNTLHDLNNGAYQFNWNTSDSEERFILHLKATATEEIEEQEAQVYVHDGQVYIRQTSSNEFNSVYIYDLAGRVIYSNSLNQQELQSINMSHSKGTYLVQLIGDHISQTEKIIIGN
ncbi:MULTISPECIES: LamG-like jellyroll fold domain-containing protein [unclassified Lentimicrobium]|uniref:LamG-like jellyroll fold domain-containing protein n=1 Tax=unclassified Lentimicrobium TaxID=2677434 RepID=UPI0015540E76|nr:MULTISPECIES: LamG-like jellyroll fold domain-containing protein [unclassified Lentimicrobium]NPD44953.1 T9SS type A sorting domain-containing protein [Lentimicrobium sp. S6]NPD86922.1 T9SS type A sorting domain-containing protein [Lentimicrobium sp. L6]